MNLSPTQEFYASKENCFATIVEARQRFGDKTTTRHQFDMIFWALGSIVLYGPEDVQVIARATLDEATVRQGYFEMSVWKEAA